MSFAEKVALNFLVWTCVFPSVLLFSYGFQWLGIEVPLWTEIGISTAMSVPLISIVCIPRIEAAIAKAEGTTPAELKLRQASEADGDAAGEARDPQAPCKAPPNSRGP